MTTSPFLPLPAGLSITTVVATDGQVVVSIRACAPSVCCPLCDHATTRIHSRYQRRVTDLPATSQPMQLVLTVRKFFCDHPACVRRIFTERLPDLVHPSARTTIRLQAMLATVGFATSGKAGARLATRCGMPASPSTILRRVMAAPLTPPASITHLGIDDFAFRRGQRYGTILVDMERKYVVDLLPERTTESAAAWLAQHPDLAVICRDRGKEYAAAVRQAAPHVLEVADRFHLVHNLVASVEPILARCRAAIRETHHPPAPPVEPPGAALATDTLPPVWRPAPAAHREPARQARHAQRVDQYDQVRTLQAQGIALPQIAAAVGMSARSVRRWLARGTMPQPSRRTRASQFDRYAGYVLERWQAGTRNGLQLWREIQAQGYPHSSYMVYRFLAVLRDGTPPTMLRPATAPERDVPPTAKAAAPPPVARGPDLPAARQAVWLLIRPPTTLETADQQTLGVLCQGSATVATTYRLVQAFMDLVHKRASHTLEDWLTTVDASAIPELRQFAAGIRRDRAAVEAGLTTAWNSGRVEGHVHRVKVLKRQMYGRAGFALLRQRVLART